jgi:ribulose-phosphate 3-epimerase
MIKLAPSILASDFSRLGEQVTLATRGDADYIHIDVMDGHFVPNLTLGPAIVKSIRSYTSLPFDVHLMIEHPEDFIGHFAEAGANLITVHVEACTHLHRVVDHIGEHDLIPGVAINPATSLATLEEILPFVRQVNVMTVNPGFGGQSFVFEMLDKIARLRAMIIERGLDVDIEVDGGVDEYTAPRCVRAGANVLVAGTSVFGDDSRVIEKMKALRQSAGIKKRAPEARVRKKTKTA